MKPTPKNRGKILSRPHNLQRPDPKNGPLLAVNTIMAGLCDLIEAQTRAGERNFAAESWAELAADLAHSLPDKKIVCIHEGNETTAFHNLKRAFEISPNKKLERGQFVATIELMVLAGRAATGTRDTDNGHAQLAHLLKHARLIEPQDMEKFAKIVAPDPVAPAEAETPAAQESQGKKADLSKATRLAAIKFILGGNQYEFPVLKTGDVVAVIQPRDYTGKSITNMAELIRDILRKNLGENIRIAQVYETDPESVSEIIGTTGGGPEWTPWVGEVPGLKTWLAQHENQNR